MKSMYQRQRLVMIEIVKILHKKLSLFRIFIRNSIAPSLRSFPLKELIKLSKLLKVTPNEIKNSFEKAIQAYHKFKENLLRTGKETLEKIAKEPKIILVGRPYLFSTIETNLGLPRKLSSRGFHVIPADMLPFIERKTNSRNLWYFTQYFNNALAYSDKYPNIYICMLSCFNCMPDDILYHKVRSEMAGRIFCYLEIDAHTAHAGFDTRIGAFLDIIQGAIPIII